MYSFESFAMSPTPGRFTKLSVLVAAFNEAATLRRRITRVLTTPLPHGLSCEVIVVDDGSTDSTWKIAQELAGEHAQVRVFRQRENQGKGAALRRAIAVAMQ